MIELLLRFTSDRRICRPQMQSAPAASRTRPPSWILRRALELVLPRAPELVLRCTSTGFGARPSSFSPPPLPSAKIPLHPAAAAGQDLAPPRCSLPQSDPFFAIAMPFQFQFPWLKNPTNNTTAASTFNPSPNPRPRPHIPNPFDPVQAHLTSFLSSLPRALPAPPPWARIAPPTSVQTRAQTSPASGLPPSEIEERLAGVPVYALANAAHEFVLVSSTRAGPERGESSTPSPALGLLCFRKEDADALLAQMEGDMRAGSSVVSVALNKVIQLKSDGVAFRFLPDSSQVANAIKVTIFLLEDEGLYVRQGFPGVPIFQEDLDKSLHRTSRDQQKPNPAVRVGDTQVSSLEDIIKSMKDSSSSNWDEVVFIPPGFDLATGSKP
ncbi:hypothetical protein PR202_gb12732 [Eleusine coracana subsp. coracana]|uniref:Protein TIC 22-like, chloroplastic n=1 Tax=Eleusine coracana subsp. coracana TaxID=191504 RepID=A0AAV5ERB9_ELECO|nr:hypothetical protein PR202_gb12732 [Eleusine coracana subsp. coracana]